LRERRKSNNKRKKDKGMKERNEERKKEMKNEIKKEIEGDEM
jgi:hypothetical protein